MLNKIFSLTEIADGKMTEKADGKIMELALNSIIDESAFAYEALLFQLPAKQKELLFAICNAARLKISCRRHSSRSTIFLPPVLYKVASKDYWRKILLQKQMEPTNCTISSLVNG